MRIGLHVILFFTLPAWIAAQTGETGLVWPSPPEHTRLRHLQTISSFEKLQGSKGFFSRLLSFFAGGEQTPRWLVQPVGIAVTRAGKIYVADPGAKGVHVIDQKERTYDFVPGTKKENFVSPAGVAIADDGTVYISDSQRGVIDVLDDTHDFKFEIRDHLQRPAGLFLSGGKLFVADAGRHAVVVFDLNGRFEAEYGRRGAGSGEFNFPISITAGNDDTSGIFVVDALNYRVQELSSDGRFLSTFGQQGNLAGRFASPKSIARDSDGDLYVSDALMDNIQIFDGRGTLLLVIGHTGKGDGEFNSPGGIAIDRENRMYVVETLNRRIQIFQYMR